MRRALHARVCETYSQGAGVGDALICSRRGASTVTPRTLSLPVLAPPSGGANTACPPSPSPPCTIGASVDWCSLVAVDPHRVHRDRAAASCLGDASPDSPPLPPATPGRDGPSTTTRPPRVLWAAPSSAPVVEVTLSHRGVGGRRDESGRPPSSHPAVLIPDKGTSTAKREPPLATVPVRATLPPPPTPSHPRLNMIWRYA